MADPENVFSTLDDFLLSLAEGVSHAQNELAAMGWAVLAWRCWPGLGVLACGAGLAWAVLALGGAGLAGLADEETGWPGPGAGLG